MIDLSYENSTRLQETANSYIISKPGEYCFPLVPGNAISSGHSNIQGEFYDYRGELIRTPDLPVKPSAVKILVWDSSRDYIRNLRIHGNYVMFLVPEISDLGSNYIISAHTKDGDIIWSWHLWLWKKELRTLDCGLLDTNLGKHGDLEWFYQWGRKDPILNPGFNLRRQFKVKGCRKIDKSILYKYPGQYIKTAISINELEYFIWDQCKTIYDPCPPGYKVPEPSVFDNLKKEDGVKFLGPGYIDLDGNYQRIDEFCCYWTSGTYQYNKNTLDGNYFQVMNREEDKRQEVVYCELGYAFPIRPQKTY